MLNDQKADKVSSGPEFVASKGGFGWVVVNADSDSQIPGQLDSGDLENGQSGSSQGEREVARFAGGTEGMQFGTMLIPLESFLLSFPLSGLIKNLDLGQE